MARATVSIDTLTMDNGSAEAAGTSIVPADGAVIPAGGDTRNLLIVVENTDSSARDVTLVAPVANLHAPQSIMGSVVFEVAAESRAFFVVESARFAQALTCDIFVDFDDDFAGTIAAYRLPVGA